MGAYYREWQGYVPDPIPTTYNGKEYPSRRRALRAKREAGDTSSPSLRGPAVVYGLSLNQGGEVG